MLFAPSAGRALAKCSTGSVLSGCRARHQSEQQTVAFDRRFVGHRLVEVEDDASPFVGLDDIGTFQVSLVVRLARLAEAVDGVRKIQRNAGRLWRR
jgi:hypothetical protein